MSEKSGAIISKKSMTEDAAGKMSADQIRKTVELCITNRLRENVIALTTDFPMSIDKKTVLSLPPMNEEVITRIISVDQVSHDGKDIPVVTYTGTMTRAATKLVAELARTCEGIRGGYFPGRALLSDVKIRVGDISAPAEWKNMIVLHKKNALLFSVGETLREISTSAFCRQRLQEAKIVSKLDRPILSIGRPSENEKNVFVVTEKSIFTVGISNYTSWREMKPQSASFATRVMAYFKDGDTFISVLNNGSVELASGGAA